MNKRFRWLISAVVAFSLAFAGLASAHPWFDDGGVDSGKAVHGRKNAQHGGGAGHLPATKSNVDVVSKLKLKNVVPEKVADVGVHEGYAYVAAWGVVTCKYNGIHVVDIQDPANPEEVRFIGSKAGSYPGEGVQALEITTPKFKGDILLTNNEKCNETSGFGGINLYDVTDPESATPLYEGFGDEAVSGTGKKNAHETHSVYAWDDGPKAYAAMVDNEEAADVDIVDITNPRKPKLIAEYNLAEKFPSITQTGMPEIFLHDMVVKQIDGRQIMLLGYWDAGYVQIDVTDPRDISLVADSDYAAVDPETIPPEEETAFQTSEGKPVPPEGNGHQAEFTKRGNYVIGTDEDFDPYKPVAKNVDDGTSLTVGQGSDTEPLEPGDTLTGDAVFVGRACAGDPAPIPAPATVSGVQIAVAERGVCDFTDKVANIEAAGGYEGVLIFNRTASDGCNASLSMTVSGGLPTFGVAPRLQGFEIFDIGSRYDNAACLAGDGTQQAPIAMGTVGDKLTFSSYYDGWGYVHLFDRATMTDLDTYAIPEAHDPAYAEGFGDLSVHEVATSQQDNKLAYYAYYAGGFRVTRIANGKLEEVGRFIDSGGSNIWGVEVFNDGDEEYVAASDRDYGLYIFKTKNEAAPTP